MFHRHVKRETLGSGGDHRPRRPGAAGAEGFLGGVLGVSAQRLGAPLAVSVRVDDDAHRRGAVGEDDALGQVLDCVDRLPAAPDEQPDVFADDAAEEHALALLDLDLDLETQPVDDLLEELREGLRRPELLIGAELPIELAV